MKNSVTDRLDEQIRTALSHLACDHVEQAKAVLLTALGLPADLALPPPSLKDQAHLVKLADACTRGVKAWSHMAEDGRMVVADALLAAASELSTKQMLDALFEHCPVQMFPDYTYGHHLGHPIEHNPAQGKDERARIEKELRLRMSVEKAPALSDASPSL